MRRQRPTPEQFGFDFLPPASEAEASQRLRRKQGDDPAMLLAHAQTLLATYDVGVLGREAETVLEGIAAEVDQIAILLNGGTSFGMAVDGGGLRQVEAALRAADGAVPRWGQPGRFLVTLEAGCRVWVDYDGLTGIHHPHFSAYVVDVAVPFLSETGYRSFSDIGYRAYHEQADVFPPRPPMPVDAWCRLVMDAYVVSKDKETRKQPGLVAVDAQYTAYYREHPVCLEA